MSLLNNPEPTEPGAPVAAVKHAEPIYPKRGEDGEIIEEEPTPDPEGTPAPEPTPEPVPDDSKLTEEEWTAKQREGVPETPDAYEIPDIEGFDKEAAADSAIFKTMREAAHKAGLKPDDFNKLVEDYVAAETAETNEFHKSQMALLGKDEAAQQQRVSQVNAALTRLLPKELAEGLMAVAATAPAVQAIEALLNRAPTAAPSAPPAPKDDADTIKALMNSKEYMGYEHERDAKVVARVDKFFADGGTIRG